MGIAKPENTIIINTMKHFVVCIDDAKITRKWYDVVLLPQLNNISWEIFGEDASCIPAFLAAALNASLIIIDQNLDYADASFQGTELAQRLRRDGFTGCIASYTSSRQPVEFFTDKGVDLVLYKGDALLEITRRLIIELDKV